MSTDNQNRNKRKRKKSFLKNARKYAKKGQFGRGSQLEADTYQYLVRIMETYREGFDKEEDKIIFVNNVFDQTVNEEIKFSQNQVGCRVIELLLPFANNTVLERFMEAFSKDLRPLCSDSFATHVLEAIVRQTCLKSLSPQETDEFRKKCKEFTFKISRFLLNNLEDFIWDTYGNHVLRTCLYNLAQIPNKPSKNTTNQPKIETKIEPTEQTLPEDHIEFVNDCGERLITWPQFNELCSSELTSGFLQVLLKALSKVNLKLLKKYVRKLLDDCFAPANTENTAEILPPVFLCNASILLLETTLLVASKKLFTQIYLKCFVGKIAKLAKTRMTNFAVQKLIANCSEKTEFEAIFDELGDYFKEIIQEGHTGVLLALAQGCKRLMAKQGPFVQSLMKSLDCETDDRQTSFIICLSRFKPYENEQNTDNIQKEKLNLNGTLILQLLLEFNKPIKIVNSLLEMETDVLKNLFSNTMGSHIVDSYVKSQFVGEKSREKLVRKMKGTYQELASTKYGSRSFEAIWNAAGLKHKQSIMEELSYKDGLWSNSEHGKIIASKVNLALFKRNKEEWKNNLNKTDTKEMFADLLNK